MIPVFAATRRPSAAAAGLVVGTLLIAGVNACRPGVPIVDTAPRPAQMDGTISGSVRGPEGTSPIQGRTIEAVNVVTGERHRETTSTTGGYTFKLAPGRYRVEVSLLEGEAIVKQPGVIELSKSDVDSGIDIIVGQIRK